jgi:hypothetical protein
VLGVPIAVIRLDLFDPDEEPSDRQRELFRVVSQMVVPRTDTTGAGDVEVGDFVLLALAHGLEQSRTPMPEGADPELIEYQRKDGSLEHAHWLEAELDRRAEGDFLNADEASRTTALTALDVEAFAESVRVHPWRTVKALILTGYYTSEAGGSQELRFELVPGRYDPDLPITPKTRAYSSDWTAVEFG